MTIQCVYGIGPHVAKRSTYRGVIKHLTLAQYVEGFFVHRHSYQWGDMFQLKGNERIKLREFGKKPEGEVEE